MCRTRAYCPVYAVELLQALGSRAALDLSAQLQQQPELLGDLLSLQARHGSVLGFEMRPRV